MLSRKLGAILLAIVVGASLIKMTPSNAKPVEAGAPCSGVVEFAVSGNSPGGLLKNEIATWLSMRPEYIVDSTIQLYKWSYAYSIDRPVSMLVFYHVADCD